MCCFLKGQKVSVEYYKNVLQNFWLVYFKVICACRLQEPGKRIFIARPELYLCIDHYY